MGIITLTTDLGYRDFYLAAVKGSILNLLPQTQIIDISHSISAFNIAQGAFIIRNAYAYFPKKTIHLIGINTDYTAEPEFIAFQYKDHFFLGPDNGIFSLICDEIPEKMVEISGTSVSKVLHFPLLEILAKSACRLLEGVDLNDLGISRNEWSKKVHLKPVLGPGYIRGTVIYIDDYQNVITNITRKEFEERVKGRFLIRFKRNETINKISYHYGEVPEGEKLGLFGISDHLEIAINKGKAAGLLGLRMDDTVQIDFEEFTR